MTDPSTIPPTFGRYAVAEVWCGPSGWGMKRIVTADEVAAGEVRRKGWNHYNHDVCHIRRVFSSPTCERCGQPSEPDGSFDPGTGHWERCLCPSWKERALKAEAAESNRGRGGAITDLATIKARRDWRTGKDLSPFELRLDDECLARHYAEDVTLLLEIIEGGHADE